MNPLQIGMWSFKEVPLLLFDKFECCFSSIFRVDYIITPLKILQSLKDSVTPPDEKYSLVRKLSPQSAAAYNFSQEEVCSQCFMHIYW